MPRLNKTLRTLIRLARFAKEQELDAATVADMVALAQTVFNANVRACNIPDQDGPLERARERLATYVYALGYGVEYNGLWPTLTHTFTDHLGPHVERIDLPGCD